MFGSPILEVAIGLILVYLLLSLICSALQEALEAKLKYRASNLEQGLREILNDPDGTKLLKDLYNHPLLFGLFKGNYDPVKPRSWGTSNLPAYIPAANFAAALLDTIVRGPVSTNDSTPVSAGGLSFASLHATVTNTTTLNKSVQRVLLIALDSANGDITKVQAAIESWFNNGMERVSGWYKRQTQFILFCLGLAITILLNVDTLRIATELYRDTTLRTSIVSQAEIVSKGTSLPTGNLNDQITKIQNLKLPIGWQGYPQPGLVKDFWIALGNSALGWMLTACAISFGAPFWFDILNKFMTIRSSVKTFEKTPAASSPQQKERLNA